MILMGERCPEQCHEAIAQELIDSPLVAMHRVECYLKKAIEERVHCFGSNTLGNRGRVRQVTEEYGDLFPFAFEGTPGNQNFLGKVFRSIGQGFAYLVWGWNRGECWGARDW